MYIVLIAWLYVAFMMSAAEATNTNGTVLGAVVTFVLYGLLPVSILMYIMGTPGRKRLLREREAAEMQAARALQEAGAVPLSHAAAPDTGSQTAADAVPAGMGERHFVVANDAVVEVRDVEGAVGRQLGVVPSRRRGGHGLLAARRAGLRGRRHERDGAAP